MPQICDTKDLASQSNPIRSITYPIGYVGTMAPVSHCGVRSPKRSAVEYTPTFRSSACGAGGPIGSHQVASGRHRIGSSRSASGLLGVESLAASDQIRSYRIRSGARLVLVRVYRIRSDQTASDQGSDRIRSEGAPCPGARISYQIRSDRIRPGVRPYQIWGEPCPGARISYRRPASRPRPCRTVGPPPPSRCCRAPPPSPARRRRQARRGLALTWERAQRPMRPERSGRCGR